VDKCPPTHLAFPGHSLFHCGPPQYLHGSHGSGLPGAGVRSRIRGCRGGCGVRDRPGVVYTGAGGGGMGVSMSSVIWWRSANVVGRCSSICVRCSFRVSPTIVCTSCGSASTGT